MISNEVVHRAHAMVGEDVLREPLEVCLFLFDQWTVVSSEFVVCVAMPWLPTMRCLWPLLVVLEAEGSAASVRRLQRHLPRLSRQGRGHQREKQTGARQQNVSVCTPFDRYGIPSIHQWMLRLCTVLYALNRLALYLLHFCEVWYCFYLSIMLTLTASSRSQLNLITLSHLFLT